MTTNYKSIVRFKDGSKGTFMVNGIADPIEHIRVRIDDKLSRVMSGQQDEDEDVELDLIGYLVLLQLARKAKTEASNDYDPT